MKIHYYFMFLAAVFFTSSCSDVKTELWLEKDGSGKMEVSVDMANFFPSELADMGGEMGEDSEDEIEFEDMEEPSEDLDPMALLIEGIISGDTIPRIDTTVNIPGNPNQNVQLVGDPDSGTAFLHFHLSFNSPEEFLKLFEESPIPDMGIIMEEDDDEPVFHAGAINLKQKFVKMPLMYMDSKEMGENMGMDPEEDMGFSPEMFKAMMGNSVTHVHLPGKVMFTNDPEAEINGNTVVFKRSLFDVFEGKGEQRLIKYK